ncbi:DUF3367 domain-containing protein, partial [Patescibacteria group bacterium]|nr:DUF3367 domain-containing protein [Patescibacteria group bacterium]
MLFDRLLAYFKTNIPTIRFVAICFVLSLFTVVRHLGKDFIISFGESSVYLNPFYFNYFSTWEDKLNFGSLYPHQSNIYLFVFAWKLLSIFNFVLHPSVLFIFLSTFLSVLSFYFSAKSVLGNKYALLIMPAALLFGFNPFRLIGPINERLNLLSMFLPLFFATYYKLLHTKKYKYAFILVLLSLFSSSMGANLPVFSIPYVLMFFYFVFFILSEKPSIFTSSGYKQLRFLLPVHLLLLILILVANSFWIFPQIIELYQVFLNSSGGKTLFVANTSGSFFDHWRFLGSWAWRSSHYENLYYSFSKGYYQPFLVLTASFITLLSLINIIRKNKHEKEYLLIFMNLLSVVSFILLAGVKGPFKYPYKLMYTLLPITRMYREPFTKFTPLFAFAICFCLVFSLDILFKKISSVRQRKILLTVVYLAILLNSYPMFTGESMPVKRWNGAQWGTLVKIPDYWKEAVSFIDTEVVSERILIFPFSSYGSSNNWEYGVNVAGNIADFLVTKNILRGWDGDFSATGEVLKSIYAYPLDFNLAKYLAFLGIDTVLLENDLEWRYVRDAVSPSSSSKILTDVGFEKRAQFGLFDKARLLNILNEEVDENLRYELYAQLLGSYGLELYQSSFGDINRRFYIPSSLVKTNAENGELKRILSFNDVPTDVAIYPLDASVTNHAAEYIFGERITNIDTFADLSWNMGWIWPEVNIDPASWRYYLIQVKEFFQKLAPASDYRRKVDLLTWLSVKRVVEIKKYEPSYQVRNKLIKAHTADITEAIRILKDLHDQESGNRYYWESVKKTLLYFNKSVFELSYLQVDNTEEQQLYDSFLAWIYNSISEECSENCYKFNLLDGGDFEVYIGSVDPTYIRESRIDLFDQDDSKIGSLDFSTPQDTGNYWSKVGNFEFEKDKIYKLNIHTVSSPNLIDSYPWRSVAENITSSDNELKMFSQNYLPLEIFKTAEERKLEDSFIVQSAGVYKDIQKWSNYKKYKLSFDYKVSAGILEVSVAENVPNYKKLYVSKQVEEYTKLPLTRKEYIEEPCKSGTDCFVHAETHLNSSPDALNAVLYMRAIPNVGRVAEVVVKNVRLEEISTPTLVLKRTVPVIPVPAPEIVYTKLSPSKYTVTVTNAKAPYTLVFMERFNPWWDLKFEGKELANSSHAVVNGFANSWQILPDDVSGKDSYVLTVEFGLQ